MNDIQNKNQSELTNFSKEKLDLIKKHFFPPHATELDMAYCLSIANQYNLDPVLKQIFFVPRSANIQGKWVEKIEPLVGRDGFLAIAHKTGKFAGIKSYSEIRNVPKLVNGVWQNKPDLVAIAEVFRTDSTKSFVVEVAYSEYVQTKHNGDPTNFWANKPETMLKKVAESQSLRKAFNLSGLYSPEELGVGLVDENGAGVIIDTEAVQNNVNIQEENTKIIHNEIDSLAVLGLSLEEKNGFVRVVGSTYGLTDELKRLGYKFKTEKKIWWKKIA